MADNKPVPAERPASDATAIKKAHEKYVASGGKPPTF